MIVRSLIVIPAFNEEATVSNVVSSCAKYCDVLVVDDGSTDKTYRAATESGAVVIPNKINKGYEHCLNVGYSYAHKLGYDLMITMDADGQFPSKSIPKFLDAIEGGASLAVGRRKKISRVCEKLLSFFSSRFGTILDPYCGMKAYKLKVLTRKNFSDYNSIGTSLAFEYFEKNLKCANIDIYVDERQGKSKFGGKLASEFKLIHSMFIGNYRLLKNWMKERVVGNAKL